MTRHFVAVLIILAAVTLVPAENAADPPPDKPLVVKLAPSASGKKTRALKYTLLPDPLDLKPGNAATYWRRAGRLAVVVKRRFTEKEYLWVNSETALKDLPRKEVREFLALYAAPLRLADQAARCDHCDWEYPLPTIQHLEDLPLDEVQTCRELANLLQLRCRLELSDGKFDDALFTLQSGFALARHVGDADTLIQDLVAIAIAAIMFNRVEELMQVPGSPNLFWALTALPQPFIDIRRSMQVELNTIYRSFPQLRDLERNAAKTPLSAKETEKLIDEFLGEWQKITGGQPGEAWQGRAAMAALALKVYPDAKKYLADQGYSKEEIEALPALQTVFVWYLDQYNQTRDNYLKWMNAPPWQAQPKLDQIALETTKEMKAGIANPMIALMLPAISKVYGAYVRTENLIGRLRCAEALRLYAAAHDGKAPEKFADLGELPLPINAYTGKGFEEMYQFHDGKGVLETPMPPPLPKSLGRRYEIGK
jgi:hypothetical protein